MESASGVGRNKIQKKFQKKWRKISCSPRLYYTLWSNQGGKSKKRAKEKTIEREKTINRDLKEAQQYQRTTGTCYETNNLNGISKKKSPIYKIFRLVSFADPSIYRILKNSNIARRERDIFKTSRISINNGMLTKQSLK